MKKKKKTYNCFQLAAALFMIVALLWLTVSTPYVFAYQQKISENDRLEKNSPLTAGTNDEETANPFGNSTEEKASGSNSSFSEEYLHDHHINEHFFTILTHYPKCQNAGTYIAFHGELLVPPPNIA